MAVESLLSRPPPADGPLYTLLCPLPPRVPGPAHSPPTARDVFFSHVPCCLQPEEPHHLSFFSRYMVYYIELNGDGHPGLAIWPPACGQALGGPRLYPQAHEVIALGWICCWGALVKYASVFPTLSLHLAWRLTF